MAMIAEQKHIKADLKIFMSIIATLIIIGLLFIYSSSSVFALEKFGSSHHFVKKQMIGLCLGIIGLIFFRVVPIPLIKKMSPFFFLGSLLLTALTLVPGFSTSIHGSHRWLNLFGFSFQPSELLKISLVMYLAYFLSKKEGKLASFTFGYLPFLCILALSCIILLKQPDFGMTVTIVATTFILLFIMNLKTKHLIMTMTVLAPVSLLLIYLKPYRWHRVLIFLNPWNDPQGAGFQVIQSLIAIGSGSFWGMGISNSKQKFFYLPMQHTDFIFSIIAEETGFIGAAVLIMLYTLFIYFGMRIAWQLNDMFCVLVTLGFVILTSLQAIINIAVTTGLVPTKGIGLPFVSYGNSSLLCSLCMIGLIINCVYEQQYNNQSISLF